ncbi:hypothetical protein GCM10027290_18550 [Micromonospora sonneratiae]
MPDDLSVMLGDQRETVRGRDGVPQGVDQVSHDGAVVGTERPKVRVPHGLPVARTLFAEIHGRRVRSSPVRPHMLSVAGTTDVTPSVNARCHVDIDFDGASLADGTAVGGSGITPG